jgi:hypothetical protein
MPLATIWLREKRVISASYERERRKALVISELVPGTGVENGHYSG